MGQTQSSRKRNTLNSIEGKRLFIQFNRILKNFVIVVSTKNIFVFFVKTTFCLIWVFFENIDKELFSFVQKIDVELVNRIYREQTERGFSFHNCTSSLLQQSSSCWTRGSDKLMEFFVFISGKISRREQRTSRCWNSSNGWWDRETVTNHWWRPQTMARYWIQRNCKWTRRTHSDGWWTRHSIGLWWSQRNVWYPHFFTCYPTLLFCFFCF